MSLPSRPDHLRDLERLLTDPQRIQPGDLPLLRRSGLSGYLRAALPADHPLREVLRVDMLPLSFRHAHIRRELRELLVAWTQAGVPFLLLKGFHMAEFEYATPGERFHGDVDILLPEDFDLIDKAARIGISRGWRSDGQHNAPEHWTHETMHLYSPDGHIRLDVHRHLTAVTPRAHPPRDLTAGVWQRATPHNWDGLNILRLHPLDAAVHLVLNRCWGGDSGGIKPADYADLLTLTRRHGLTPQALAQHAGRWGGPHTWAAFTRLCHPWQGRLTLNPAATAPALKGGAAKDGVSQRRWLWQGRLRTLRQVWPVLPTTLQDVLSAWWALRRGGDPRLPLRRWTPEHPTRRASYAQVLDLLSAVSWWTRLLYPRQRRLGVCAPRAYASYRALRKIGHPVVFYSGVSKSRAGVTGHAWIEDDRGEMEAFETGNRQRYRVMIRFPEEP